MKKYIIILTLFSLFACKSNKLISTDDINNIIVTIDPLKINGKPKEVYINNKDNILFIINNLNSARKELAKFRPTYRLEINYINNKKIIVLCNAQRINIEGITYKLNSDIEKIILLNP